MVDAPTFPTLDAPAQVAANARAPDIDVLMITYNRAPYTRLSLRRLLDTCGGGVRVWLWHNGEDRATLDVVHEFKDEPPVYAFHHSHENKRLVAPVQWLWANASGRYVGKVDDDCLVPAGWWQTLRAAHEDEPRLGAISCWHFREEDFVPEIAQRKIATFRSGHRLMRNAWIGGSGYLLKRTCLAAVRPRLEQEGLTHYWIRLAAAGWINGWYFPFLYQDHMDDPRSPHTQLRSDQDVERHLPLSAEMRGVTSLEQWNSQLRRSARLVQEAPMDPGLYFGWRKKVRRLRGRLLHVLGKDTIDYYI